MNEYVKEGGREKEREKACMCMYVRPSCAELYELYRESDRIKCQTYLTCGKLEALVECIV